MEQACGLNLLALSREGFTLSCEGFTPIPSWQEKDSPQLEKDSRWVLGVPDGLGCAGNRVRLLAAAESQLQPIHV
jgi:hypothetical protein